MFTAELVSLVNLCLVLAMLSGIVTLFFFFYDIMDTDVFEIMAFTTFIPNICVVASVYSASVNQYLPMVFYIGLFCSIFYSYCLLFYAGFVPTSTYSTPFYFWSVITFKSNCNAGVAVILIEYPLVAIALIIYESFFEKWSNFSSAVSSIPSFAPVMAPVMAPVIAPVTAVTFTDIPQMSYMIFVVGFIAVYVWVLFIQLKLVTKKGREFLDQRFFQKRQDSVYSEVPLNASLAHYQAENSESSPFADAILA